MNKLQIENLIYEFIDEMKLHYPLLNTEIYYDEQDNDYVIEHNYKNWNNNEFKLVELELTDKYFDNNGIYSVCFAFSSFVKPTNLKIKVHDEAYKWDDFDFSIAA